MSERKTGPDLLRYMLLFLCVTVPIWLLSTMLGVLLERLTKWLCQIRKGAV